MVNIDDRLISTFGFVSCTVLGIAFVVISLGLMLQRKIKGVSTDCLETLKAAQCARAQVEYAQCLSQEMIEAVNALLCSNHDAGIEIIPSAERREAERHYLQLQNQLRHTRRSVRKLKKRVASRRKKLFD